jgi:acetolactate synthase small subunit
VSFVGLVDAEHGPGVLQAPAGLFRSVQFNLK